MDNYLDIYIYTFFYMNCQSSFYTLRTREVLHMYGLFWGRTVEVPMERPF